MNSLVAQKKWALNQCVLYAISNSPQIRQYDILKEISDEIHSQSKRDLLPGVNLSSRAGFSFGRSVDPNTNEYTTAGFFNNNYTLGSSVTLFEGFRQLNRIQYEKHRKQASEYNRLNAIDDLAFGVMSAFFDVIFYKKMLELAKEQVETSKLNLKATEKQTEIGLKAKSDLLEMEANLEAEELRRIQMENSLATSRLTLLQLMNITGKSEPEPEYEEYSVLTDLIPLRNQLFNNYTTWSPCFQSFVSLLEASEKYLAVTRSALFPVLSAVGSINTGFYETYRNNMGHVFRFSEQFTNNKNHYLGISLSIPIFNCWRNRSEINLAKLEVELAKAKLESERQKLYFEMAETLNELEASEKEYLQYEKQKEADLLVYRTAEKKFEQGLISVIDLYVLKNRYANSKSQVLQARLQLEIKRKSLDFYMGKRFWEQAPSVLHEMVEPGKQ